MSDFCKKLSKLIEEAPSEAVREILQVAHEHACGDVSTADSGGGGTTNPPEPPKK